MRDLGDPRHLLTRRGLIVGLVADVQFREGACGVPSTEQLRETTAQTFRAEQKL